MSGCWFTSDQHFGHENIIKFCHRPFSNTNEMTEKLIENHNAVVKAGDRVFHLGDFCWRTLNENEVVSIISRLNGQHYYIFGNHEEILKSSKRVRDCFVWCKDAWNLKVSGYPNIWLSHYAHRVWNGSHKGAYHLYGHTHGQLPQDGSLSFDVGVDTQNFAPISLEEVSKRMKGLSEGFAGKKFVCPKCDSSFIPFHTRPTTCSKCLTQMELR